MVLNVETVRLGHLPLSETAGLWGISCNVYKMKDYPVLILGDQAIIRQIEA
jgi:hypothetical protein